MLIRFVCLVCGGPVVQLTCLWQLVVYGGLSRGDRSGRVHLVLRAARMHWECDGAQLASPTKRDKTQSQGTRD